MRWEDDTLKKKKEECEEKKRKETSRISRRVRDSWAIDKMKSTKNGKEGDNGS